MRGVPKKVFNVMRNALVLGPVHFLKLLDFLLLSFFFVCFYVLENISGVTANNKEMCCSRNAALGSGQQLRLCVSLW